MRITRALAAAVAIVAAMPRVGTAQLGSSFKDAWFWGVKAGGMDFNSATTTHRQAPLAGVEWLITRSHGGLVRLLLRGVLHRSSGDPNEQRSGGHGSAHHQSEEHAPAGRRSDGLPGEQSVRASVRGHRLLGQASQQRGACGHELRVDRPVHCARKRTSRSCERARRRTSSSAVNCA